MYRYFAGVFAHGRRVFARKVRATHVGGAYNRGTAHNAAVRHGGPGPALLQRTGQSAHRRAVCAGQKQAILKRRRVCCYD
jgi:hypothetical protein